MFTFLNISKIMGFPVIHTDPPTPPQTHQIFEKGALTPPTPRKIQKLFSTILH